MTAPELLDQLRSAGIEVRVEGDTLLCRPRSAVSDELRREIVACKPDLIAFLAAPVAAVCPGCGRADFMPLGGGWRRCWSCGRHWGRAGVADPGDPVDLAAVVALLGLDRRRRRVVRR